MKGVLFWRIVGRWLESWSGLEGVVVGVTLSAGVVSPLVFLEILVVSSCLGTFKTYGGGEIGIS